MTKQIKADLDQAVEAILNAIYKPQRTETTIIDDIRTALEQFVVEDQWINLLHKLPIQGQGVLVALSSGAITIAYLTFNKEWQLFGDINKSLVLSDDDYITHWMPLPTTPTKGGKKQ